MSAPKQFFVFPLSRQLSIGLCWLLGALTTSSVFAQPTIDVVIQSQKAMQAKVLESDGFVIRVERYQSETITPNRFSGGMLNVEFLVARQDSQFLCHKKFLGDDGTDSVYLPPKPRTITAKDGILFDWERSGPSASIRPFQQIGDMFQCLDYFRHLGWNAARPIASANKSDYRWFERRKDFADDLDHPFLPESIERFAGKYRFAAQQEAVDGAPCWVLEYPGMDKIWLDPACGYSIRRRCYHFGPGKPRKTEIWNKELKEIETGLWLPQQQIVDKYASITAEDKKIWDKVACRMYYRVTQMSVGSVPGSVFDLGITDGLIIDDTIRGIEYRASTRQGDPFSNIMYEASVGLDNYRSSRRMAIFGGVVLIAALAIAWRRSYVSKTTN